VACGGGCAGHPADHRAPGHDAAPSELADDGLVGRAQTVRMGDCHDRASGHETGETDHSVPRGEYRLVGLGREVDPPMAA
jgi:hypothetical protein